MSRHTFSCPAPCRRVIRVHTASDDDAVGKFIKAGALKCRRTDAREPCDIDHPPMPPLSDRQLKRIVRLIMTTEDLPEAATGHRRAQKTRYAMNP